MANAVDFFPSSGDESVPFRWLPLSTASIVSVAILLCLVEPKYINTIIRGAVGGSRAAVKQTMALWNYLP